VDVFLVLEQLSGFCMEPSGRYHDHAQTVGECRVGSLAVTCRKKAKWPVGG